MSGLLNAANGSLQGAPRTRPAGNPRSASLSTWNTSVRHPRHECIETSHMDIEKSFEAAAAVIKAADGPVITAGAGMGVDSGLPDFRGNEGAFCQPRRANPADAHARAPGQLLPSTAAGFGRPGR